MRFATGLLVGISIGILAQQIWGRFMKALPAA